MSFPSRPRLVVRRSSSLKFTLLLRCGAASPDLRRRGMYDYPLGAHRRQGERRQDHHRRSQFIASSPTPSPRSSPTARLQRRADTSRCRSSHRQERRHLPELVVAYGSRIGRSLIARSRLTHLVTGCACIRACRACRVAVPNPAAAPADVPPAYLCHRGAWRLNMRSPLRRRHLSSPSSSPHPASSALPADDTASSSPISYGAGACRRPPSSTTARSGFRWDDPLGWS